MSLLPPEITAALTQLLEGLCSKDNNIRTLAEDQLNSEWVAKRPDVLLVGLVLQTQNSSDPAVRPRIQPPMFPSPQSSDISLTYYCGA